MFDNMTAHWPERNTCAKCLGANAYELDKYSFANTVTLSASVIRLIAGIDASGDRRCGRDT